MNRFGSNFSIFRKKFPLRLCRRKKFFSQSLWQYLINVKAKNFCFHRRREYPEVASWKCALLRARGGRLIDCGASTWESIPTRNGDGKVEIFVCLSFKACQQTSEHSSSRFSPENKVRRLRMPVVAEVLETSKHVHILPLWRAMSVVEEEARWESNYVNVQINECICCEMVPW